jgi:hypothetical protein
LTSPTIGQPNTSGTSIWDKIFGTIERTLPASISAIKGQGVPYGYYNPQTGGYSQTPQMGYQQAPKGYSYNSSGQLVKDAVGSVTDFVGNNPLLVGGGILAVALLFMRPPSGRR